MRAKRYLALAVVGATLLASLGCVPLHALTLAAHTVPVPPWTADRLEEKFAARLKHRTAILPPIPPGTKPPACLDLPSEEEIIRALPKVTRGIPYLYEEFRDDFTIVITPLVDRVDPPVVMPLVGAVQVHHCHFKCTVYYKERIISNYPFPFYLEEDRVEVVYIDKDHLHAYVGEDEQMLKSYHEALSGP